MRAEELRKRIAKLKREKKEEEERRGLRGMERVAISEAREAKRARRVAGIGLAIEKAKVYKALPLPRLRRGDEEERIARAERQAEEAETKARKQIALSQRRTEVSRAKREATEAEAHQRAEEVTEKKARLMSEKELRTERLKPYTIAAARTGRVAGKVGVGVGKGVLGAGKLVFRGLQKLGEEGQRPRVPHKEAPIDLGFGTDEPKKKKPERPYKELPLDIDIKL